MKFVFVAVTVLFDLTQCKSTVDSTDTSDKVDNVVEVQPENPAINPEGHWTLLNVDIIEEKQSLERFVKSAEPYQGGELSPPVYKGNDGIIRPHSQVTYFSGILKDLVISEDSIFGMNYPLEFYQRKSYTIESDLLQIGNDTIKKSMVLSSDKDTLHFSYLDHYGLFLEETYVKATFDESTLNILKLYTTNFPLLAGAWVLIREEGVEYGGLYVLDFPYDIPDTLVITKEELESTLYTDRSYNMLTSGKKQKYFLNYYDSVLGLTPGDWYKEIDPSIHFIRLTEEKQD